MKINLIYKQEKYRKIERKFLLIKRFSIVSTLIFLFVLLGIFMAVISENDTYNELIETKKILDQNALENQQKEQKIDYVNKKGEVIKKAKTSEVPFEAYYRLLSPFIGSVSTDSSALNTLKITSDNTLEFSIEHVSYNDLLSNVALMESESFTSMFKSAILSSINFGGSSGKTYSLSFKGKIKSLAEMR